MVRLCLVRARADEGPCRLLRLAGLWRGFSGAVPTSAPSSDEQRITNNADALGSIGADGLYGLPRARQSDDASLNAPSCFAGDTRCSLKLGFVRRQHDACRE